MGTPERIKKYQSKIIQKNCIECGKTFRQKRSLKGICSEDCKSIRRRRFRPRTTVNCKNCGEIFEVEHLKRQYCSKKCWYEKYSTITSPKKGKKYPHLQRARIGECKVCKKKFRAINDYKERKQKYCSVECFRKDWGENIRPLIEIPKDCYLTGENNSGWKGLMACYSSKHKVVSRIKGTPKFCQHCGSTKKRKYEWANIDHEYSRDPDDYIRLCTSCHRKYDIENNGYIIGIHK